MMRCHNLEFPDVRWGWRVKPRTSDPRLCFAEIMPRSAKSDEAIALAKMAEQAERYEDMVKHMKEIVDDPEIKGADLVNEERNLISVGYKNVMSARRSSWRTIQNAEDAETDADKKALLAQYKETVAQELYDIIEEVSTKIVHTYAEGAKAASSNEPEILVFFHKLDGDYNRYGAEASSGDKREDFKNKARSAYEKAQALTAALKETNPIRLGLALNFSVFYYEIDQKKKEATELAQAAFDNAIDKLELLGEEEYRDSTLIMQLLKDNLSLWQETDEDA